MQGQTADTPEFDVLLVGGGLQNALLALALRARRPEWTIALVERERRLGGNHTWSFFETEATQAATDVLAPLVTSRWPGWDVRFPRMERTFDTGYASISSARLDEAVTSSLARRGSRLFTGRSALHVLRRSVLLDDGTRLTAKHVVDARGPDRGRFGEVSYQKFFGVELELEHPHRLERPMVMDASVPQGAELRFVYVLPLAPTRVLVEDTFFSRTPELDEDAARVSAMDYARRLGLRVRGVAREERGCLPLPHHMATPRRPSDDGPLVAGYRGGLFHPTTGYSFSVALRFALHVATANDPEGPELDRFYAELAPSFRFALLLNRILFCATRDGGARELMQRFHRLPAALVGRFYQLETTRADRVRMFLGRPPRALDYRAALSQVFP